MEATCCGCGMRRKLKCWLIDGRFKNAHQKGVNLCRECSGTVAIGDTLWHGLLSWNNRLGFTIEALPHELIMYQAKYQGSKLDLQLRAKKEKEKEKERQEREQEKKIREQEQQIREQQIREQTLIKQRKIPWSFRKLAKMAKISKSERPYFVVEDGRILHLCEILPLDVREQVYSAFNFNMPKLKSIRALANC